MATGTTTIDFGAFPGSVDTSKVISGQTGIVANSSVEAWIFPSATADHSLAEHYVDPPRVTAGEIVAGTSFTIRGFSRSEGTALVYGQWTVFWAWA